MTPTSPAARALAEQLLASAGPAPPAASGAPDPLAAPAQVGRELAAELSRWIGPYGYHALLTRALASARATHPVLGAVRVAAPPGPSLDGLADAASAHGAAAVVEGYKAVLGALIDLLGRLIGEDLAVAFIDRTILAIARDRADPTDTTQAGSP
jgi:hypothetical protein